MSDPAVTRPRAGADDSDAPAPTRELGRLGDPTRGPTLVVTGGMHGNEPGGVRAIARVLERVERQHAEGRAAPLCGRVVFVTGNRAALAQGQRFVERDLNRRWFQEEIDAARARGAAGGPEDREQLELMALFEALESEARGPLTFLDLHSTSGAAPPFCVVPDAPRNHDLAFALGLPVIFGLEEAADGTMIGHYNDRGHAGVAVEGGQHQDPRTVDRLEAAVWRMLVHLAILERGQVPRIGTFDRILRDAGRDRPRAVEIIYRHAIAPGDGFAMAPGFASFQPVRRGELLARDHHGEVRAPSGGRMLLPLYQGQGEEGFFIARDLSPARLRLAARMRALGVERALLQLPGVRAAEGTDDVVFVPPRLARGWTTETLRLLGFRRWRHRGDVVEFSRRRQIV